MTSSSVSENFIFSVQAVKYKNDNVVACIGVDDGILCLDDVNLTQDFKVLAELQNPTKRGPELEEFVDDTVANFDENLLTNANFKSLLNDENSLSKTISTYSGDATESSRNHSKTITTDSGDVTESSLKSSKHKHPQFEDTIAKRTRSTFSRSTSRSSCILQNCRAPCDSQKSSPVLKSYRKRKTQWKSKRKNVQTINTPGLEKNRQILQLNMSTESKVNQKENTELGTNINAPVQNCKQSESIETVLDSEKETRGTTEFKTNINLSLNKTVSLFNKTVEESEEISDFNENVPASCEKRTHETTESSTNSTWNKTYERSEGTSDLKKTVPDSLEGTESKSDTAMIDFVYQLDDFERMINDFRAVMIRELSSKSSPAGKKVDAKSEDGNAGREEKLLIFCMEDEYKRQFGETEDCIHGEDEVKFPTKMPNWKNKLNKYNCNNP